MGGKLWGGRFSGKLDPTAWEYNASLSFDWRLAEYDVRGSIAWAKALMKAGVINLDEQHQIVKGLTDILTEIHTGQFEHAPTDEDVHTAIERRLTELAGPVGGKLHTGRSRNDQVATDSALWLQVAIKQVEAQLKNLQSALVLRAETDQGLIIPGLHAHAALSAAPSDPLVAVLLLAAPAGPPASGATARPRFGSAAWIRRHRRHAFPR